MGMEEGSRFGVTRIRPHCQPWDTALSTASSSPTKQNPGAFKVEDVRSGWESNMSSPVTGDISNSDRDPTDTPLLDHAYAIFGIPYRRTQAEELHSVVERVSTLPA